MESKFMKEAFPNATSFKVVLSEYNLRITSINVFGK